MPEDPPDVATHDGWSAAMQALADTVAELGRYTKIEYIAEAIRCLSQGEYRYMEGAAYGVYPMTAHEAPIVVVDIRRASAAERLKAALLALGSPLITTVTIEPSVGTPSFPQLTIGFVPQPPQVADHSS